MFKVAETFNLIHSKIQCFEPMVVFKALKSFDLVLLQVKLLEIYECLETLQILDVVALTRDNCQVSKLLKSFETD